MKPLGSRFSTNTEDEDYLKDLPSYRPQPRASLSALSAAQPKAAAASLTCRPTAKSTSKEDFDIDNFGATYNSTQPVGPAATAQAVSSASSAGLGLGSSEQMEMSRRWLMRPCFRDDPPLLCYVERDKSGFNMMSPIYKLFIEVPGSSSDGARFAMSAKKKVSNRTSYYLISLDQTPSMDDRGAESILGKIRGNQVGSQYQFTDHGLAPDKATAPSMLRKEFGLVRFAFDSGGPSKIEVFIPAVSSTGGSATVWQPASDHDSIERAVDGAVTAEPKAGAAFRIEKLFYLQNKTPKWDSAHGGHVLNFQGRVTESSVKNFQLCSFDPTVSSSPDNIILQFGRVGKNKFNMDVCYPLSPFQAFAICVACMDGKLADRQGFETLRRFTGLGGSSSSEGGAKESGYGDTNINEDDFPNGRAVARGSLREPSTMTGAIREALPSRQYLADKISRTFNFYGNS